MGGGAWWATVPGVVKSRTRLSDFTFTFCFHALQKEMAAHSSVLAWRIPGTAEPGGLKSMGSQRVGHNWSDSAVAAAACCGKWQDFLLFLWCSNILLCISTKTLVNTQADVWPCPQGWNLKVAKEATRKGLKDWTWNEAAGHEGRRRASGSLGHSASPRGRCPCLGGWALALLLGLLFPARLPFLSLRPRLEG